MHIAFNGWFWNQPHVGSGQYLRHLLPALRAVAPDLQMTLVLPDHIRTFDGLPPDVSIAHAPTRFKGHLGKVWFEQRAYPAVVRRVQADIAHVPYWGPPFNTKPARLVTSVLDIIPLTLPAYRGGVRAKLYTSMVAAAAQGSAHVLTLSEASKTDIVERLHIPAEKVTVTYLAADERFHPKVGREGDEAVRRKYDLPDDFVLCVSGFDIRKNVNMLLLAWTYVGPSVGQQMPLVLAGRQPQWGTPRFPDLPDYAKKLDIERFLMWLGEFDEADKPALYRLAKAVVFPSRYEGFGLPPLEAMACGTPVIACDVSSIPEVTGEAAYLVPPDDARAMGAAILAVVVQDDLHQHLANAGLGQASLFSWRKTAQRTLDVYQQVMEA
ncbi:MAG: glycosyltransferase family 4 protein [Anaerolineales bacterium]|nr:glycosyltransferase family 4 protein [Anaerolineales bacterium]